MVTRWNIVGDTGGVDHVATEDGYYVDYDDYAALEARVAELERNAARYRWLRNQDGTSSSGAAVTINLGFDWYEYHGSVLDDVIDERMGDGND